jgi:Zn-dependent peptidase ImmA (M78 family)
VTDVDSWGVPVLSGEQLELAAEETIKTLAPEIRGRARPTPILDIIGACVRAGELSFEERADLGSDRAGRVLGKFLFSPPTILIDRFVTDSPRRRFTLAHEFGHFWLHRRPRVRRADYIVDSEEDIFSDPPPARRWLECQARRYASALVIPRESIPAAVQNAMTDLKGSGLKGARRITAIHKHVSLVYDVSVPVTTYRFRELDLPTA